MTPPRTRLAELTQELPLRLGFILARPEVRCDLCPDHYYLGPDRKPVPNAEKVPPPMWGIPGLDEVWDDYADAVEDGTLAADLSVAAHHAEQLRTDGVPCDLLYVELAALPDDLRNPQAKLFVETLDLLWPRMLLAHARFRGLPPDLLELGYDISHPGGDHSAILNPGVLWPPGIEADLNAACLFPTLDAARKYLPAANAMDYASAPFCVLRVCTIAPREEGASA